MGNLNETNSMEMREASKDSISSVDRTSDEAKSAGFQEKHVAKAYPTAAEGPKLRASFLTLIRDCILTCGSGCSVLPSFWPFR
jgi:hypothetical protein